jgi:DHA1 family multidrug resistance protein-like MFS transporter
MAIHSWLRASTFGTVVRLATKNKVFKYPEERDDFQCPAAYVGNGLETPGSPASVVAEESDEKDLEKTDLEKTETPNEATLAEHREQLARIPTVEAEGAHIEAIHSRSSKIQRVGSGVEPHKTITQKDLEAQFNASLEDDGVSRPIIPTKTKEGYILVDWYTTDDIENPQNWPLKKKILTTLQICLYTTAVYMGSSIVTASEPDLIRIYGVSQQAASLSLSMYVLGYGLGPMLFSPLSEIPRIGRNPPYMITFAIFVILIVPAALVQNFPGFIVLRFLLGFFGSPCLATGGASLQDMYSFLYMPFAVCMWALAATCGPALGPIISGFSVPAEGWRWSSWEMLWLAGPIFLAMFFFLPETNPSTILYQRAQRLRSRENNSRVMSQSEIDQANMSVTGLILENLYRPFQMIALDPAVAFTALYTALIYGIYYSFFEAFPLVYIDMYGFTLGKMGLTFLAISVGVIIAIAMYWAYLYFSVIPWVKANGFASPERRLLPALLFTWLCPIGLFIFGWTANPDIHWIVPTIGIMLFTLGIFIVIQCIFVFLPLTYPQYAASLFAGNDLTRSALAAGAIHFSSPMFVKLGVGRGVSILGGLTVGCCFGLYALWYYGARLRAASRFSAK